MAFADLLQADLDGILAGDGPAEPVEYLKSTPSGLAPGVEIRAMVQEDSQEEPLALGITPPAEGLAIVVTLSKTDIECVQKAADKVCWRGQLYRVSRILRSDPAAWRLYCVR